MYFLAFNACKKIYFKKFGDIGIIFNETWKSFGPIIYDVNILHLVALSKVKVS